MFISFKIGKHCFDSAVGIGVVIIILYNLAVLLKVSFKILLDTAMKVSVGYLQYLEYFSLNRLFLIESVTWLAVTLRKILRLI